MYAIHGVTKDANDLLLLSRASKSKGGFLMHLRTKIERVKQNRPRSRHASLSLKRLAMRLATWVTICQKQHIVLEPRREGVGEGDGQLRRPVLA